VTAAKRGENRETVRTFLRWIYNNLLIGTQATFMGIEISILAQLLQIQALWETILIHLIHQIHS